MTQMPVNTRPWNHQLDGLFDQYLTFSIVDLLETPREPAENCNRAEGERGMHAEF